MLKVFWMKTFLHPHCSSVGRKVFCRHAYEDFIRSRAAWELVLRKFLHWLEAFIQCQATAQRNVSLPARFICKDFSTSRMHLNSKSLKKPYACRQTMWKTIRAGSLATSHYPPSIRHHVVKLLFPSCPVHICVETIRVTKGRDSAPILKPSEIRRKKEYFYYLINVFPFFLSRCRYVRWSGHGSNSAFFYYCIGWACFCVVCTTS